MLIYHYYYILSKLGSTFAVDILYMTMAVVVIYVEYLSDSNPHNPTKGITHVDLTNDD